MVCIQDNREIALLSEQSFSSPFPCSVQSGNKHHCRPQFSIKTMSNCLLSYYNNSHINMWVKYLTISNEIMISQSCAKGLTCGRSSSRLSQHYSLGYRCLLFHRWETEAQRLCTLTTWLGAAYEQSSLACDTPLSTTL